MPFSSFSIIKTLQRTTRLTKCPLQRAFAFCKANEWHSKRFYSKWCLKLWTNCQFVEMASGQTFHHQTNIPTQGTLAKHVNTQPNFQAISLRRSYHICISNRGVRGTCNVGRNNVVSWANVLGNNCVRHVCFGAYALGRILGHCCISKWRCLLRGAKSNFANVRDCVRWQPVWIVCIVHAQDGQAKNPR